MNDYELKKQKTYFAIACLIGGLLVSGTMYVSAYLKTLGLSTAKVSFFVSLRSIVGIFAPMIWGVVCDYFQTNKKPYVVCLICTMVLFPLIPFSETVLHLIAITPWLTILSRLFYRPLDSIMSSWIAILQHEDPRFDYNRIKLFGEIGSMLGSLLYSYLLSFLSLRIGFYGVGFFGIFVLALTPLLKDAKRQEKNNSFKNLHFIEIIKNPELVIFYLFAIAISIPSCCGINYTTYIIDEVGGKQNIMSIIFLIDSIIRMPLYFFANKIYKKLSFRSVLVVGAILSGGAHFLYANAHSIASLLLAGAIFGFVDGLRYTTLILYSFTLAPKNLRNTVILLNSTVSGASTSAAAVLASLTIDAYGIGTFFKCSGVISIVSAIIFALICKFYLNEKSLLSS